MTLRGKETTITAAAASAAGRVQKDSVRVVWDRYSQPRYRFAIDDNVFFHEGFLGGKDPDAKA